MTSATPEQRLEELGLVLPPPAAAVANYVPWAITGNLIMTSGNLPWRDGKLAYTGKIGRELSGEDGYKCCQLSCLNAIAQLRDAAGDLSRIKRVVRLEGTNVEQGMAILKAAPYPIIIADSLADAANKAVAAAK